MGEHNGLMVSKERTVFYLLMGLVTLGLTAVLFASDVCIQTAYNAGTKENNNRVR